MTLNPLNGGVYLEVGWVLNPTLINLIMNSEIYVAIATPVVLLSALAIVIYREKRKMKK